MKLDRMQCLSWWRSAQLLEKRLTELKNVANKAMTFKVQFYDPVSASTGIPWYVVAALDMREESFDHNGYLGNGDPLDRVTTHVPRGRGPFASWHEGAIDALTMDGFKALPAGGHWDVVTALVKCEEYNGIGYAERNLPSPYVWGGTTIQVAGKYVGDGEWSATTWDTQPGCAALFLALKQFHGVDLSES